VKLEMPIASDHGTLMRSQPGTALRLAEMAALLSDTTRDVAPLPGDPECNGDLRCAIRHLELVCGALSTTAGAMAYAATYDPTSDPFAVAPPAARATAWRLHDVSHALRTAAQACTAACETAQHLELPATEQRGP
jgi:hypothetical protein